MNHFAQTALQLLKELSFPLVAATAWTVYRWTGFFADAVTNFVTALFFAAWFSGQLFRVSKQTRTEGSFRNVEARLDGIVERLEDATTRLLNTVTGGSSYALLMFGDTGTGFHLISLT